MSSRMKVTNLLYPCRLTNYECAVVECRSSSVPSPPPITPSYVAEPSLADVIHSSGFPRLTGRRLVTSPAPIEHVHVKLPRRLRCITSAIIFSRWRTTRLPGNEVGNQRDGIWLLRKIPRKNLAREKAYQKGKFCRFFLPENR